MLGAGGRMISKEHMHARIEVTPTCWLWTGTINANGYAFVWDADHGNYRQGHRVMYQLLVGPIPEGLQLDHTCHAPGTGCTGGPARLHRRCVNPAHLEPVTGAENMRRMAAVNTHCKWGHEWTPENTHRRPTVGRTCLTCAREQRARRYRETGK